MRFDADAFGLKGMVIGNTAKTANALRYYIRALRFQQEGFQLTNESWYQIAKGMTGLAYQDVTRMCQAASSNREGQLLPSPELTGIHYTEHDYFNVKAAPKAKSVYINNTPAPALTNEMLVPAWGQMQTITTFDAISQMTTSATFDPRTGDFETRIVPTAQMVEPRQLTVAEIERELLGLRNIAARPEEAIGEVLLDDDVDNF
jgi:hypothetical protein